MKYLAILSEKRIFNYNFVLEITKTRTLADETIQNYLKKGFIKRVKKNLYVTVSLENSGVIPTKYEIASNVTSSSYVSLHSAFEYYGFTNQVYTEVTVSSLERFKDFTFENNQYHYVYCRSDSFIESISGVRVSSLAKTIVDTIDNVKSYDDLEEVLFNISSLPVIDGLQILEYLMILDKKILFNKVGLILSFYKEQFMIDDLLLIRIKNSGIKSVKYFTKEKYRLKKYYKEWDLYCYDLDNIVME